MAKNRKKIIIMGAAGRDFHNFNTLYRDNGDIEVVVQSLDYGLDVLTTPVSGTNCLM